MWEAIQLRRWPSQASDVLDLSVGDIQAESDRVKGGTELGHENSVAPDKCPLKTARSTAAFRSFWIWSGLSPLTSRRYVLSMVSVMSLGLAKCFAAPLCPCLGKLQAWAKRGVFRDLSSAGT